MNVLKIKLVLLLLLVYGITYSSNIAKKDEKGNQKFFSTIELGMYKGLKLTSDYSEANTLDHANPYSKSLRFILGYFINPHVSTAIGFGADRFEDPGANTFPLFLDFRGYLKDAKNTPFVFFDVGKTAVFSSQAQEGGNLFDGGFGYKFFIGEKTCLNAKVGYNYFKNKEWAWQSTDINSLNPASETYRWFYLKRQSITFSIGLMF